MSPGNRPVLRGALLIGTLVLLGCHQGAGRSAPERCAPMSEPGAATLPAAALAGEYRLRLDSETGTQAFTVGSLRLVALDSSPTRRTGTYGIPDTMHRYPLVGTARIDLAAIGAVAPGGTASTDPSAPGVLVIERAGKSPADPILLRFGATANRAEPTPFEGGYTVLRVRRAERDGFSGEWESGAPLPQAGGHFCAIRDDGGT